MYGISMGDFHHGDVLCVHLVTEQLQIGANGIVRVRAGGMDRPSRTKSHLSGSLSSSQPGGQPCWTSPLAFGLIASTSKFGSTTTTCPEVEFFDIIGGKSLNSFPLLFKVTLITDFTPPPPREQKQFETGL